jgi:hypothetical protein
MLVKIIRRAKELISREEKVAAASDAFDFFLHQTGGDTLVEQHLDIFCRLDDHDVMATVKNWSLHPDKILAMLCRSLVERRLYKVKLQAEPIDKGLEAEKTKEVVDKLGISSKDAGYFVFTGTTSNTTYDPSEEQINILFKDGSIKNISEVDNALIQRHLSSTIKKYYICYYRF